MNSACMLCKGKCVTSLGLLYLGTVVHEKSHISTTNRKKEEERKEEKERRKERRERKKQTNISHAQATYCTHKQQLQQLRKIIYAKIIDALALHALLVVIHKTLLNKDLSSECEIYHRWIRYLPTPNAQANPPDNYLIILQLVHNTYQVIIDLSRSELLHIVLTEGTA